MSVVHHGAEPIRCAQIGGSRIELLPRAAYEAVYTAGQAVIGYAFESQSGMHAFASSRKVAFRTRPNSLAFVPAGCDVYSQSAKGGEYLTLAISLDADEAPAERRFNDLVDPTAIETAEALRRLLLTPGPLDPLALERHALTLRDCAARALREGLGQPRAAQWLTPQRHRHIDDLIEARLDGSLTVRDLASALHLSAGFFSRAFKAATGKPPHAYILDRRIARARQLLRRAARRDLSAIAQACGFASHAHMTTAFRARLGAAPSELRQIAR
jgi:AraC family transcriptional regulator